MKHMMIGSELIQHPVTMGLAGWLAGSIINFRRERARSGCAPPSMIVSREETEALLCSLFCPPVVPRTVHSDFPYMDYHFLP